MSNQIKLRFSLRNIYKEFKQHSIGPVNLDISDGEVLGLTGKTGCGKSTLAKIIMRLSHYDSGIIAYKDKPLSSAPIRTFRQHNQMMFQNHLLSVNSLLKIGKIIQEPMKIVKKPDIEIKERIDNLLDMFELKSDLLEKYPDELSGGEIQKLVFIRTLVLKPEFVILDEPFSNMGRAMSLRLIESINRTREEFGLGILVITHSPEFAELFSDRILKFSELIQPEYP